MLCLNEGTRRPGGRRVVCCPMAVRGRGWNMTKTISKLSTCAFLFCALAGTAHGQAVDLGPAAEPLEFEYSGQLIEVAIALDTSGSMKSLRDAARLKLWEIVQETALLEPAPTQHVLRR